jgi:hypothetical protein
MPSFQTSFQTPWVSSPSWLAANIRRSRCAKVSDCQRELGEAAIVWEARLAAERFRCLARYCAGANPACTITGAAGGDESKRSSAVCYLVAIGGKRKTFAHREFFAF